MARASADQAASPARQSSARLRAQLLVAVGRVEEPPDDELRRDVPFQRFSFSRHARS